MGAKFVAGRNKDKQGWTIKQIEHSRNVTKQTALVCAGCVDRGFTPKDLETYTCEGCDVKQGRSKFAPIDIQNQKRKKQFPSLPHMQGQRKTLARIGQVRASMAMHVRQQTSPAKVHGLMPTLSRPMSRLQPRRPLRGHQIPTEEVLQSTVAQLIPWPSQQMAQSSFALSSVYSRAMN
jgi:hypothetical protein